MLRFGNFPLRGRCRPPLHVWPRDIGPPADPGLRKHAQKLEQDGGCSDAGDAASVEWWRDLDQIGPDEIETAEFADQSLGFERREAARFWRPCSRRIGGIERIDRRGADRAE
jgi:hypothetical protein